MTNPLTPEKLAELRALMEAVRANPGWNDILLRNRLYECLPALLDAAEWAASNGMPRSDYPPAAQAFAELREKYGNDFSLAETIPDAAEQAAGGGDDTKKIVEGFKSAYHAAAKERDAAQAEAHRQKESVEAIRNNFANRLEKVEHERDALAAKLAAMENERRQADHVLTLVKESRDAALVKVKEVEEERDDAEDQCAAAERELDEAWDEWDVLAEGLKTTRDEARAKLHRAEAEAARLKNLLQRSMTYIEPNTYWVGTGSVPTITMGHADLIKEIKEALADGREGS